MQAVSILRKEGRALGGIGRQFVYNAFKLAGI
jgi:hypothetical protein